MRNLPRKKVTKVLSLAVSFLMVVQTAVWANPDIAVSQNSNLNLQVKTLFTLIEENSGMPEALTKYIPEALNKLEEELAAIRQMHSAYMAVKAREFERKLKSDDRIPSSMMVVAGEGKEELTVDFGICRIRYYNPRQAGSEKVNGGYTVVHEKKLGSYCSRQVLISSEAREDQDNVTAELKKAVNALQADLPALSIVLPAFSTIAVNTSIEGDDSNREAALNLFEAQ